jgi:hypothetical protein
MSPICGKGFKLTEIYKNIYKASIKPFPSGRLGHPSGLYIIIKRPKLYSLLGTWEIIKNGSNRSKKKICENIRLAYFVKKILDFYFENQWSYRCFVLKVFRPQDSNGKTLWENF